MTTLIGISGSLRQGSYNSSLLRIAASMMPAGSAMQIESIAGIPLYNGDDETATGIPTTAAQLKEAIASADGLLLVSPEYNHSVPGVAKNAIDWLSRPPADIRRVFGGKPVAIAGASIGGFGTMLSQNAWLPILHALGTDVWSGGSLLLSKAVNAFDEKGDLKDEAARENVRRFIEGFVAYVASRKNSLRSD